MGFSGNYKGIVKSRSIKKSQNGAVQFCVKFVLTEKMTGNKYLKIQHEAETFYEVWGNLTLLNCDGSINNAQLKSLKQSLKWNGESLKFLNEIDIIGREFPISISMDENGKSRVNWINSDTYTPSADLDSLDDDWKKCSAANLKDYG